jgi:hypothetical protein
MWPATIARLADVDFFHEDVCMEKIKTPITPTMTMEINTSNRLNPFE